MREKLRERSCEREAMREKLRERSYEREATREKFWTYPQNGSVLALPLGLNAAL